MDQAAAGNTSAVIDQDKNVDAMYKELQIIKGSIKKLMIDIREEMNNAENPFLNLQQLQAPTADKEMNNMDTPGEKPEAVAPEEPETVNKAETEKASPMKEPEARKKAAAMEEVANIEPNDIEVPKAIPESDGYTLRIDAGRLDPDTIIKLMQWTRMVMVKNGMVRFHKLLDIYVTMGYLSVEMKDVIEKISLLVAPEIKHAPKGIDIKEYVGDMYMLFMILNPKDKNLDSKMLSVMLGYEDRMLSIP